MCRKGAGIETLGSLARGRCEGQGRPNEGRFDFTRAAWGAPGPRAAAPGRAFPGAPHVRDHRVGAANSGGGGTVPGFPASLWRSRRRMNLPGGWSPLWIVVDHAGHKPEFATPCGERHLNCGGNGTGRRRPASATPGATTPRRERRTRPPRPPPTARAAFPVANATPAADAPHATHPTGGEDPDGSAWARAVSGIQLPGYRRAYGNGLKLLAGIVREARGKEPGGKGRPRSSSRRRSLPCRSRRPAPAATAVVARATVHGAGLGCAVAWVGRRRLHSPTAFAGREGCP